MRRRQRLESLAAVPELVLARPDGSGGWHLSVVRRGRLVAAGSAPRGTSVRATLAGLLATAETLLGPDGEQRGLGRRDRAGPALDGEAGHPAGRADGTLACPAPGTGAFTPSSPGSRAAHRRDPFADGRSLGTRARPERVTAGVGGRPPAPASIAGVITAIVMIDAATDAIPEVAASIADLDGVSEVYSTAGEVDLIAIVRVREFEQIAEVIAGRINKVPGRARDRDAHRVPRLLPPRPRGGLLDRLRDRRLRGPVPRVRAGPGRG